MNQQQLELRLLHQKHIDNMLALERQRLLLDKENPYKQTFIGEKVIKPQIKSNFPVLKPDPYVQRILYNPLSATEGKVADIVIDNILNNWNRQCKVIPSDVNIRNILKMQKRNQFSKELTAQGNQQIQEILIAAHKNGVTRPLQTIREKYSQRNPIKCFDQNKTKQIQDYDKVTTRKY